jgi:hypothetical protein
MSAGQVSGSMTDVGVTSARPARLLQALFSQVPTHGHSSHTPSPPILEQILGRDSVEFVTPLNGRRRANCASSGGFALDDLLDRSDMPAEGVPLVLYGSIATAIAGPDEATARVWTCQ